MPETGEKDKARHVTGPVCPAYVLRIFLFVKSTFRATCPDSAIYAMIDEEFLSTVDVESITSISSTLDGNVNTFEGFVLARISLAFSFASHFSWSLSDWKK